MTALTLIISSKNYSSWSMRPWVLMRGLGIPFVEKQIKFGPNYPAKFKEVSPSGRLPLLIEGDGPDAAKTWETTAIFERLNEIAPEKHVWPADARPRSVARAICAEMHAGFKGIRSTMPANVRGRYPGKGMNNDVRADVARISEIWAGTYRTFSSGGDFLFGAFGGADAYYAPVACRFQTYGVALEGEARAYCDRLLQAPAVAEWIAAGEAEGGYFAPHEPYDPAPPQP